MIQFVSGNIFRCICGYGQLFLLCMITSCANRADHQNHSAMAVLVVLFMACWVGLIVSRFVL
jgi:hypothetical protein